MKVRKDNRILSVDENDKSFYLSEGYDVVKEKDGKYEVVEAATGGKTYTVAEYNKVVEERDALQKELQKLKSKKKKDNEPAEGDK